MILIWTRPEDGFKGGDLVQATELANAIGRHEKVDLWDRQYAKKEDLEPYHTVILVVYDCETTKTRLEAAKGKKIICAMIYRE